MRSPHSTEPPLWYYGIHTCAAILANPRRKILRVCYLQEETLQKVLPKGAETLCEAQDKRFFDSLFLKSSPLKSRSALPHPLKGQQKGHHRTDQLPANPVGDVQNVVHQGIAVQAIPLPSPPLEDLWSASLASSKGFVAVLDHVGDPHNVGAILRSAAVFGCRALVMTDRHAPFESATLAKSASGALEHVPLIRVTNLAQALRQMQQNGFWTVGLCEEGEAFLPDILTNPKLALDKVALILGAEGEGMRRLTKELCDFKAKLPTAGSFTTLNVSNAAAIAFYEAFKELGTRKN